VQPALAKSSHALLAAAQAIRQSLLPDDSPAAPAAAAAAAEPPPPQHHHQQQPQQQQSGAAPRALQDALASYTGGPVFLVTDIRSTGSAADNIATLPGAAFLYGVSIGICMSSAMSEPGGAGLGTVGWHEVGARVC
jgi:hypothetical protein